MLPSNFRFKKKVAQFSETSLNILSSRLIIFRNLQQRTATTILSLKSWNMRRGSVLVAVAGPLPKFKEAITDPFGRINIALTLIICLIGLIWQIYTVSADYFAYSVVSEVYIEKRDDVIPPALSLCLPYADVVEDNMIDVQKRWKSDRYISMEMQEHLTISELFEVTRHLKFFAESAWVRKKNSYNVSVGWSYLNVVKYLKDYYACYKISNVDADTPNFHWRSHHISFGRNPGAQMGIYLNKRKLQKVSRASVVLTEVNDYPRGDRDFPLNLFDDSTSSNDDGDVADDDNSVEGTGIFTDSATFWSLAYTKVTQKLLPPPFMTACRNFRPQFESRYECIDDCVIEKSLAEFNQSIFIVTFTKPGKYGNITVLSKKKLKDDPHLEKRVDKIIDECSGMCKGQDCLKVYFMPILLSKLDDDQRVIFTLFDMNGPETSLLFHKK